MKAIGGVIAAPLKALGLIHSPPPAAAPLPVASRDMISDQDSQLDELRRRKGGAADILTGYGGAEAGAGGKTTLG